MPPTVSFGLASFHNELKRSETKRNENEKKRNEMKRNIFAVAAFVSVCFFHFHCSFFILIFVYHFHKKNWAQDWPFLFPLWLDWCLGFTCRACDNVGHFGVPLVVCSNFWKTSWKILWRQFRAILLWRFQKLKKANSDISWGLPGWKILEEIFKHVTLQNVLIAT